MTLLGVLYEELQEKRILYRAYLERDVWSLVEASFLASGLVPIPDDCREEAEEYPFAASIRMHAIDACLAGNLNSQQLGSCFYVKPKEFLEWLNNKRWPLPKELIEELKFSKLFTLKTPKCVRENTRNYLKILIQDAVERIAARLGYFNQKHIYDDKEMTQLLSELLDDIGNYRTYSEGTVKSWISENDPRPKGERRGRPSGSTKQ